MFLRVSLEEIFQESIHSYTICAVIHTVWYIQLMYNYTSKSNTTKTGMTNLFIGKIKLVNNNRVYMIV